MAMKTANQDIYRRIMSAASKIANGARNNEPITELEGRRLSAKAHIENQILLGRSYLSDEDVTELAILLHELDDDYTADATTTNEEATHTRTLPALGEYDLPEEDEDIA